MTSSLGPVSVTAAGTVVAETVTGSAQVALAALIVAGAGTRVVAGQAAVSLPGLVLTASGDGTSLVVGVAVVELGAVTVAAVGIGSPPTAPGHALRAGVPVAHRGLTAGTPVTIRAVAGEPTAVTGVRAGQPVRGLDRLTGVPMIVSGLRAGEPR